MKRSLAIIYLIVYALLIVFSSLITSKNLTQELNGVVGVQVHSLAFACMLFYVFNSPTSKLSWFPKMVAVFLIAYDVVSFFIDFFIENHSSSQVFYLAAVADIVLVVPSWYMCFKYAFVKK